MYLEDSTFSADLVTDLPYEGNSSEQLLYLDFSHPPFLCNHVDLWKAFPSSHTEIPHVAIS